MRSKFAILLAVAAVCVTTAWAGWAPEEQVTKNKNSNSLAPWNGHKVVVATNGVRHLVWSAPGALYKRYYPGSGWTSDYQFTSVKNSTWPAIALDSNGTDIHVVWEGTGGSGNKATKHIYYQKCVPGASGNGGWVGTPKDLTPNAWPYSYRAPAVACYQGHVVVTWEEWNYGDRIGFCECVGGAWQAPQYFVDPSGTGKMAFNPSIAVDPQARYGDVFISTVLVTDWSWVYTIRRTGGVWQAWEDATANGDVSCFHSSIEIDPNTGYPHIISDCYGNMHIYHTYWDPADGWCQLEMISDPNALRSHDPSMTFTGGSAFVAWAESSSSGVVGTRYSTGQYGNWTSPAWVTSGYPDDNPSITARSNGDVFVVWEDGRTTSKQIWGRLYAPGSFGSQAEPTALSRSGIELFPNPAKAGLVTVQYSLPHAGPMTVTLLDVSGRAVKTQEVAAGPRGSVTIDVNGLNAGVYVARLVTGDCTVSKSLVVER